MDVIDPLGDWYIENACTHDVLVTIDGYATEVAPPPPGCTWGTFGGVLEEINTGLPRLRLDVGFFKALRY